MIRKMLILKFLYYNWIENQVKQLSERSQRSHRNPASTCPFYFDLITPGQVTGDNASSTWKLCPSFLQFLALLLSHLLLCPVLPCAFPVSRTLGILYFSRAVSEFRLIRRSVSIPAHQFCCLGCSLSSPNSFPPALGHTLNILLPYEAEVFKNIFLLCTAVIWGHTYTTHKSRTLNPIVCP